MSFDPTSQDARGRFRWPRDGPGLLFAMAFPTVATWLYFVVFAGQSTMRPAFAAGKVLQFAFPLLWVRWVLRRSIRPRRPSSEGIWIGIALGLLALAALGGAYAFLLKHGPAFAEAPARIRAKLADFGAATPLRFLGLALFISVLHSLLEEYYWRWFVFGRLREAMAWPAAAAVSSLAFMSHHVIVLNCYVRPDYFWTVTAPLSAGVAVGGAAWAWLYHRTGSLVGPWISHLLADAALMGIGYDMVWGT